MRLYESKERQYKTIMTILIPFLISNILVLVFPSLRQYSYITYITNYFDSPANSFIGNYLYFYFAIFFYALIFLYWSGIPVRITDVFKLPMMGYKYFAGDKITRTFTLVKVDTDVEKHGRHFIFRIIGIILSVVSIVVFIPVGIGMLQQVLVGKLSATTNVLNAYVENSFAFLVFMFCLCLLDCSLALIHHKFSFIGHIINLTYKKPIKRFKMLPIKSKSRDKITLFFYYFLFILGCLLLLHLFFSYYRSLFLEILHGKGADVWEKEVAGFVSTLSILPILLVFLKSRLINEVFKFLMFFLIKSKVFVPCSVREESFLDGKKISGQVVQCYVYYRRVMNSKSSTSEIKTDKIKHSTN